MKFKIQHFEDLKKMGKKKQNSQKIATVVDRIAFCISNMVNIIILFCFIRFFFQAHNQHLMNPRY
jgi:hypothetical protein